MGGEEVWPDKNQGEVVVLDPGSSTFKLVSRRRVGRRRTKETVWLSGPAAGVQAGRIIDEEEAVVSLRELLLAWQKETGLLPGRVDCLLAPVDLMIGEHLIERSMEHLIGQAENKVLRLHPAAKQQTVDELMRVHLLAAAAGYGSRDGYVAIHVEPLEWQRMGRTVALRALTYALPMAQLAGWQRLLRRIGIKSVRWHVAALTYAGTLLSPTACQVGAVVVDCGARTTVVALYHGGVLREVSVIPLGGSHITADLAIGLGRGVSAAEEIKRYWAEGGTVENQLLVEKIIFDRMQEICLLVRNYLSQKTREGYCWPGGIVLTGGTGTMPLMADELSRLLGLPVQQGRSGCFRGGVPGSLQAGVCLLTWLEQRSCGWRWGQTS